jgi:ribonuclease HI
MTKYAISYDMAIELTYRCLEKMQALDRHKGTDVSKVERLFDMNLELKDLIDQIRHDHPDIDQVIADIRDKLIKKYQYEKLEVFVDGAARNNDDPKKENLSGCAYAIFADGKLLFKHSVALGGKVQLPKLRNEPYSLVAPIVSATNNVVEYMGMVYALEYLITNELTAKHVEIFSDSQILVLQTNRVTSTRVSNLVRLRNCAWELMSEFENLTLTYIPREKNAYVDKMLCLFLDQLQGVIRNLDTKRVIGRCVRT